MARALLALLLAFVLMSVTSGQTSCPFVDECQERFQDEAKDIGHDHAEYCELQRQELLCAQNVLSRCPPDTRAFAKAQIQRMQGEQLTTCGASLTVSSTIVLSLVSILAFLLKNFM